MSNHVTEDLDSILGALAGVYVQEGKAREVAILALGKARIEQTGYDNWDGGTYEYTIYLELPDTLYFQLADDHEEIEKGLATTVKQITRLYQNQYIESFILATELSVDPKWRDKAKAWVSGSGVTNQGRARSDNLAPRMCDGLLFRSEPEINLYRALKSLGVSFAPLPVFIRGGQTYRRIEPDFVIIKDGVVLVVEVDGDTVHRESPQESHERLTMLLHEGAHLERIRAGDCDTPEKAKASANRILGVIQKLKTNK